MILINRTQVWRKKEHLSCSSLTAFSTFGFTLQKKLQHEQTTQENQKKIAETALKGLHFPFTVILIGLYQATPVEAPVQHYTAIINTFHFNSHKQTEK